MSIPRVIHIIQIPFTGVGTNNGFHGNEWYADRVEVFKKTCLASLKNQSYKNFMLWLTFRPEERDNPITAEIRRELDTLDAEYIMTFDGLMYFDDKFSKRPSVFVKNLLRAGRDSIRTRSNRFRGLWETKNDTLVQRVDASLAVIKEHFTKRTFPTIDWVFLTHLDSDDMLHRDAIKEIASWPGFRGAYRFQSGYIYNGITGAIAPWTPKTNPPFHTIVFPGDIFLNAEQHVVYYHGYESHEDVPRAFDTIRLSDGMYCVYTHNPLMHISTTFSHPFTGHIITDPEKRRELLNAFGLPEYP